MKHIQFAPGWVAMVAVCLCAIKAGAQTTATPVFTLPAGTYSMPQSTTITDSTAGAVILWCYNVSSSCTPATSYSGSIYINPPATVELCSNATASGHPQSATACALYTNGGASGTTATPPTASPAAGSYTAAQTVSLTTTNLCAHMSSSGCARVYYTTDGSTPDYTSTVFVGDSSPILVTANMTINAIAGVVSSTTAGSGSTPYESSSLAGWKQPDCYGKAWSSTTAYSRGDGVKSGSKQYVALSGNTNSQPPNGNWQQVGCVADNPGGSKFPLTVSDPSGAISGNPTGLITSGCLSNGGAGPCFMISQTPASNSQTNALWARSGGLSSGAPVPTWSYADFWYFLPMANGSKVSACENDSQFFDTTDDLNFQWGNQVKGCGTATADWQVGGTTNTNWISTGITAPLALSTWHHIQKLDFRKASEIANPLCSSGGTKFPCEYYDHWIIDGVSYNLQTGTISTGGTFTPCPSRPAGSGTGCTITTDTLESGFGANASNQHQLDSDQSSGTPVQVSAIVDKATYTSSFDPSSVASFVYTIASAPTLTGVSLATTGGVTGLMIGQTNQLAATCSYSDGSMTSCNTADSHGNYVAGWASSNPSVATINGTGLVTAVATGTTMFTATAGGHTSAGLPLTVSVVPSGTYTITITGPVTITGTVTF